MRSIETSVQSALQPVSRRRFLLGSLAASAALSISACTAAPQPKPKGLTSLTSEEYELFKKSAEILLPTEAFDLTPVERLPLFENIDRTMAIFHPDTRRDLGIGLKLFAYGSIFIGFHFARFVNLGPESAQAYCTAWQNGNAIQRGVFSALRQIVYLAYWREPETWGPIGYDGPVTKRFGIPRLGNTPLPEDG